MKKILFLFFFCFPSLFVFSQARNSSVEYLKIKRDAVSIDLPFTDKTVYNAIVDEFQKKGYKGKENKGFLVFKEVKMSEMGNKTLDYYFLTEKKSKKEKDATTLSLALSKDLDQFITESDDEILNDAKKFLDEFRNIAYYYDLEEQIKSQQEVILKSEKKLNGLVDEGKDFEKKRKKIEEQIEANNQNQAAQKKDFEEQKNILDKLKEKRKS